MAITLTADWRVKQGGLVQAIRDVVKAKPIIERHGGTVRMQVPVAGGEPGTYSVSVTCADWAAYAAYMAGLAADPEWQKFQAKVLQQSDPPSTLEAQTLWMDIELVTADGVAPS
jgi:hypothetical protein